MKILHVFAEKTLRYLELFAIIKSVRVQKLLSIKNLKLKKLH